MDTIILPERWQKSNERQIYAAPTGLGKLWAVISINMALLAELPAPDGIPLKTAKNQKKALPPGSRLEARIAFRLGIRHHRLFRVGHMPFTESEVCSFAMALRDLVINRIK